MKTQRIWFVTLAILDLALLFTAPLLIQLFSQLP